MAKILHGHAGYLTMSAVKPIDKQKIIDGIRRNDKHPEILIDAIAHNTVKYLEQKNQEGLVKAIEYFQLAADTYQLIGNVELSQLCLLEIARAKSLLQ
jgi:ABC-type branched-subunit amino acid transport system ATPase component